MLSNVFNALAARVVAMVALGTVCLSGLTGCSSGSRVMITTEPPGSTVTVRDPANNRVVQTGPAPVEVSLSYPDGNGRYIVEATPSEANQERFQPTTRELTLAAVQELPLAGSAHQMNVRLDEKEFVNVPTLIVVVDPTLGWQGLVTQRRGYEYTTEQGGRPPQRIREFKEGQGVRGMAIAPDVDGGRTAMIVYSLATIREEEFKAATAAPAATASANKSKKTEPEAPRTKLIGLQRCNLQGVNLQGGGTEAFTSEDFLDVDPAFTADGKHIILASNRRRSVFSDILQIVSTARSGGIANIYVDSRDTTIVRPTQASNGMYVFNLYPEKWESQDQAQIWTLDGPNKYPTQIALGTQPAVSPDGSRIAYIFKGNLWVCYADGTGATQLTSDAEEITKKYAASLGPAEKPLFEQERLRSFSAYSYPCWSPDSRFLVYTSMEGADPTGRPNEDIWVRAADGTGAQQLTTNPSADRYPLVSPDGKSIYFFSNRGKRWAIWRVDAPPIFAKH